MTTKVPFSMTSAQVFDPCDYGADPTNVVAFNFLTSGAIGVNTGTYAGNAPRQNDYKRAMLKGATGSRPTLDAAQQGVQYLDTTLAAAGKLITWTGTAWVDATGAAV